MRNQYEKDIITCYKSTWDIYNEIPSVSLVLEEYKDFKSEEVKEYAIEFYDDVGCYDEINRVEYLGLANIDYDRVGFEQDSCATDIDVVLEEAGYVFKRDDREIVNSSKIYLFSKEWYYG